jgi:hypothetical protein
MDNDEAKFRYVFRGMPRCELRPAPLFCDWLLE